MRKRSVLLCVAASLTGPHVTMAANPPAATPTLSPGPGTYASGQKVTIADTTTGGTIWYTTNGTIPTTSSNKYSGPLTLTGTTTISAMATATGYTQSAVVTATYTVLPSAAAPVFMPAAGTYATAQLVAISSSTHNASIFYTTDGTIPTTKSTAYSGPIAVGGSETLRAIATAGGYVASAATTAAYTITTPALIYTVAGDGIEGYSGDGGSATESETNFGPGAAVDSAGNIYLADSRNNVIRKIAAGTGTITTVAGNGHFGYSGDNGPATGAELAFPDAIALDSARNLYIGDTQNCAVRKVSAATGVITTFAGNGSCGYSGDSGPANKAQIRRTLGIVLDGANNLYIADYGSSVIRKVTAATGQISTFAGTGTKGYSGDGGPAAKAEFHNPSGMAFDPAGNLYIADYTNNVIRKITMATGKISTYAGSGYLAGTGGGAYSGDGGPATKAELDNPQAVAFDATGNIYIAGNNDNRVRTVSAKTGIITTYAGTGYDIGNGNAYRDFTGDGGPATSAELLYPSGVAVDPAGNLYIADQGNQLIREVTAPAPRPTKATAAPRFSLATGSYASGQTVALSTPTPRAAIYFTIDGSAPTTASTIYGKPLSIPATATVKALAVAPGLLASAASSAAYTITSPPAAVVSRVAGDGTSGTFGSGIAATSEALKVPEGVAYDAAGNLYIADTDNCVIWKVTTKTGIINLIAGGGSKPCLSNAGDGGPAAKADLALPTAVTLDGAGNIYIADTGNNEIRKVTVKTGTISAVAGNGKPGYSGDTGLATAAELHTPNGIAVDSAGNLYIADSGNNVLRKVTASTGRITTFAGNGYGAGQGYGGYSGDGGPAASAELYYPEGVAVDAAGDVYIADSYNNAVRKVAAGSGLISTIAGNGDFGYSGDGGPGKAAELFYPQNIAIDGAGDVYIADTLNNVVRKWTAVTGVVTTIAGNGYGAGSFYLVGGSSGDGGAATNARFFLPTGVAVDPSGSLAIADSANNNIRKITFAK